MDDKDFANLLVEKLVASPEKADKADARQFHKRNRIDTLRLSDADEIWKLFVRYNLETGGIRSGIVENHWNKIPDGSILKNRNRLLEDMGRLELQKCYGNFTVSCQMTYKKSERLNKHGCMIDKCPVIELTQDLSWHRSHYKVAKIIAECAKRLLIENPNTKNGNLNEIIRSIFDKHKGKSDDWRSSATQEFIALFENIKGYGDPPKVVIWMLSDLSSPVHQVNHWPDIDLGQLTPIDIHVKRLVMRFGWVAKPTNEDIRRKLAELYPVEPRKLDFALYRLGAESEENICGDDPKCGKCREQFPEIYENCPSGEKIV